jgi:hypothetical protein
MMTAKTMAMAHPVKSFTSNENDSTLPVVALKRKD